MNPSIRILHLEDNPRDAALVRDLVTAGGERYEIVHAANRKEFQAALAQGGFDVILCDYNLPDFDGLSALNLALEKFPVTPVILVSGAIDSEEAVKCLKAGATDYLLKQRLDRLPSAVRHALEQAEMRRQRHVAIEALRKSESSLAKAQAIAHVGSWEWDLRTNEAQWSDEQYRIFGYRPQEIPATYDLFRRAVHPEDRESVQRGVDAALKNSEPFAAEYRILLPNGNIRWLQANAEVIRDAKSEPIFMTGTVQDITERKNMERQMHRTQRLESIGTLASGVAHDINNALAPIMMANELLRREFPEKGARYLELIQSGTSRAADMVKQLLTFAKGAEGEKLLLQPKHLLKEMEKLIKSTFPKNLELRMSCPNDLHTIRGNATQLHQVLLNLCVNARDAMPNGGTLTLKAENKEIDRNYASAVTAAKPGQYVMWRVMDTGTGIPPDVMDRIFEPFFTTKADKGTGLGLSTVFGIVKSHGGFLRVYSAPGQGSTFAVNLPAVSATGDTVLPTQDDLSFRGHGETILVVDDEPDVCLVARDLLMDLNFKVIIARDGHTALGQVAEHREKLRAVITDLHMPRKDGLAFVRELKAIAPSVAIIVASGQADDKARNEFKQLGVHALMDKPFTQQELVAVLKTVLQK